MMSREPRALKLASKSTKLSSKKLNLFVPTLQVQGFEQVVCGLQCHENTAALVVFLSTSTSSSNLRHFDTYLPLPANQGSKTNTGYRVLDPASACNNAGLSCTRKPCKSTALSTGARKVLKPLASQAGTEH